MKKIVLVSIIISTMMCQNIKDNTHYYAYGLDNSVLSHKSGTNRFKYNNKEEDEPLGLIHYGARFYDPSLGRWISTDPIKEYHSPYTYVGNNPVNYVDPNGMFSDKTSNVTFYFDFSDEDITKLSNLGVSIDDLKKNVMGAYSDAEIDVKIVVGKGPYSVMNNVGDDVNNLIRLDWRKPGRGDIGQSKNLENGIVQIAPNQYADTIDDLDGKTSDKYTTFLSNVILHETGHSILKGYKGDSYSFIAHTDFRYEVNKIMQNVDTMAEGVKLKTSYGVQKFSKQNLIRLKVLTGRMQVTSEIFHTLFIRYQSESSYKNGRKEVIYHDPIDLDKKYFNDSLKKGLNKRKKHY